MKIDKIEYLKKIEHIDEMLNNEKLLDIYISDIANNEFEVPPNIEEIIRNNINNENKKNTRKNNYKFLNILKVACFTLVVMITWTAMTNISIGNKTSEGLTKDKVINNQRENKISAICGKVNEFTSAFSTALLSPIEFEGGER